MNINEYARGDGFGFGVQGRMGQPIEGRIVIDDSDMPTSSGIQNGYFHRNETDYESDDDPTIAAKKLMFPDYRSNRFGSDKKSSHFDKKGLFSRPHEDLRESDLDSLLMELKKMYTDGPEKKQTLDSATNEPSTTTVSDDLKEFVRQVSTWPNYPSREDISKLDGCDRSDPRVVSWRFISNAPPALGGPDPLSLMIDMDLFPVEMNVERFSLFLKPIYIDGCAVAQLYNPSYCTYFHAKTASLPWTKLHVLNVIPLVMVATHFLVRGHKVVIFLPKYYENIYYFKTMCKVDDPSQFEVLRSLGLIEFIEMNTAPIKFLDEVIRERVKKVNACLVSSPHVERMYRQVRQYIWEDEDEHNTSTDPVDLIDCSSKADDGMITPCFLGKNKLLVIHIGCTYFKGDDITKHEHRKYLYDSIAHEQILFYPTSIEHHEQHFAHDFQLTLKEQITKLLKLAVLQSLTTKELMAIKTILAVGRHYSPWDTIRTFYQTVGNEPEIRTSPAIIQLNEDRLIPDSSDSETDEEDFNAPIDFGDF